MTLNDAAFYLGILLGGVASGGIVYVAHRFTAIKHHDLEEKHDALIPRHLRFLGLVIWSVACVMFALATLQLWLPLAMFVAMLLPLFTYEAFPLVVANQQPPPETDHLSDVAKEILLRELRKKPNDH
jgi:hypothetical protein